MSAPANTGAIFPLAHQIIDLIVSSRATCHESIAALQIAEAVVGHAPIFAGLDYVEDFVGRGIDQG
jgi:hypothetical protein